MSTPPDPPTPSDVTLRQRLRNRMGARSFLNRAAHWLLTGASWWLLTFGLLYVAGGAFLGWRAAYEVLLGLTAPGQTRHSAFAYVLSLSGWLLVPAIIGGAAGYFLGRQIDARRPLSEEEIRDRVTSPEQPATPGPDRAHRLRIRSLVELEADEGEGRRFVERYVEGPHAGNREAAEEHWSATIQFVADNWARLEGLTPAVAAAEAERLARAAAFNAAQLDRCFVCDQNRRV
ncbi:DUF6313 family protein [Streptomyces sp. NPDC050732]|uniref:DUF6313 family protein n=1 Tax=Streptomyces sp. NPDC050732 TaxID=3154632 RepID=UPI00341BE7F1